MGPTIEISRLTLDLLNSMAVETGMRPSDLLEHAMADFHRTWASEGLRDEVEAFRDYRTKLDEEEQFSPLRPAQPVVSIPGPLGSQR